jgi:hypothetical protein
MKDEDLLTAELYKNLYTNGQGGFINNAIYWSSSSGIISAAWGLNIINGALNNDNSKNWTLFVRAVRAF